MNPGPDRPDSDDGAPPLAPMLARRQTRVRVNARLRARGVPAKSCARCYVILPFTAFPKDRTRQDGRFPQCRACHAQREARRREDPRVRAMAAGNGRRYRALKYGAEYDGHQPEDVWLHWEDEGFYCCVVCGGPFEHIDHNVPLIRGGGHTLDNLMPLCADHNLAKSGRCPYRFIAELFPRLAPYLAPYFDVHERLTDEEIEQRVNDYYETT